MGFVIFAALFVLIGIIAILAAVFGPKTITKNTGYRGGTETNPTHIGFIGALVAAVCLVLAALIFIPSGIKDVPSRTVGVPITFGKAGQPLSPGFHWEMPWTSVASITTKVQTDNYNQDKSISNWTGTCITVRLADAQEGCADVSVSYQAKDAAAPQLYLDYGSGGDVMNQIQSNLVYRGIRDGLNNTLQNYNPVTDAIQSSTSGTSQYSKFDPQVVSYLNGSIGKYVTIVSYDINYIHLPNELQDLVNGIQNKQGQYQQELEQQQINTATATANKDLVSNTGTLSSSQIQQECFTIVQDAEKDNYTLPATWSCTGGTSSAIVDTGK